MFPANGQNYKLGRGSLLCYPITSGIVSSGGIIIGDMNSCSLSWAVENSTFRSNTQANRPIVSEPTVTRDLTLSVEALEHTQFNRLLFFYGEQAAANQASATAEAFAFTAVTTGLAYSLGGRNLSALTATADGSLDLVEGEDYTLYADRGYITFTPGGQVVDGMDVSGQFNKAETVISRIRVGKVSEQLAYLEYIADDLNLGGSTRKTIIRVWKAQITPDGEYGLITENERGGFALNFKVLDDSANHPDDPFCHIED